jgi:hypothetical protein
MLKGTTESGFKFKIDERIADDLELLEDIARADKDVTVFPAVLERVLGEKQKAALYDHIRKEHGYVSTQATVDMFTEIMNLAGEATKNS